MRYTDIRSCHIGPALISPEYFIPEHIFFYQAKGSVTVFDGHRTFSMQPGDYCILRKNRLVRYSKFQDKGQFEKILIVFDEAFLQQHNNVHQASTATAQDDGSFLLVENNELIHSFVRSLSPYYSGAEEIDTAFTDIKRQELLLILLKSNPELGQVLFNFGIPQKIALEEFMNRNFRFNISLERFAFLTGRSLSSFKRDFEKTFHESPGRWLIRKRLDEAYFLIQNERKKPTDIYIELGFEDLSHFSYVFKKHFGIAPSALARKQYSTTAVHG